MRRKEKRKRGERPFLSHSVPLLSPTSQAPPPSLSLSYQKSLVKIATRTFFP